MNVWKESVGMGRIMAVIFTGVPGGRLASGGSTWTSYISKRAVAGAALPMRRTMARIMLIDESFIRGDCGDRFNFGGILQLL
jgi:hypothetical protein